MADAVLQGVLLGLLLSILIGPVFFALIETSIHKGFKAALIMNAGVLLSDIICLSIAYWGAYSLIRDMADQRLFYIIGGSVFIIFGLVKLLKKQPQLQPVIINANTALRLFLKGMLLNGINPSVILFWLGTVALASSKYPLDSRLVFIFFLFTIATVIITDISKIYLAGKLKRFMSEGFLSKVNLVTGAVFCLFGLIMIINS